MHSIPKHVFRIVLLFAVVAIVAVAIQPAQAQKAAVRAVLFYSPTCSHCHKVITEDLPPLFEKYGNQLQIIGINVGVADGQDLYQAAIQQFNIAEDRLGVPCLIVGNTVLVGSFEIPDQLPGIIEEGLSQGGIDWPSIPGLEQVLSESEQSPIEGQGNSDPTNIENNDSALEMAAGATLAEKFQRDLAGNTLSVIVLLGMIVSFGFSSWQVLLTKKQHISMLPKWVMPILLLIGIFVAGYLSYIEITETTAVCGPVGDCNTVQQSPYARLFGILPIGVLGLAGYLAIGVTWLMQTYGSAKMRNSASLAAWAMAVIGVLFSMYLTFLEPFVIGATCAWCLSSAIVMSLILYALTPLAFPAWRNLAGR